MSGARACCSLNTPNAVMLPCSAMQEYQQGSFGKPSEGFGITRSLSRHAAGSRSNSDKSGHLGSTGFSDPYLSLPNKFGASPSSSNLGGRIGKLFKKPSQDEGFGVGGRPSQRIVGTGAEALIGETSSVLQVGSASLRATLSVVVDAVDCRTDWWCLRTCIRGS